MIENEANDAEPPSRPDVVAMQPPTKRPSLTYHYQPPPPQKERAIPCLWLCKCTFVLAMIGVLFFGALYLSGGALLHFLGDLYNEDREIQFLSIGWIIMGSCLIAMFLFGTIAGCSESKIAAGMFITLSVVYAALTIWITIKSVDSGSGITSNLSQRWGLMGDKVKSTLQTRLQCCGFQDLSDRPLQPCPASAAVGCVNGISNLMKNVSRILKIGMVLNIMVFLVFILMVALISFV